MYIIKIIYIIIVYICSLEETSKAGKRYENGFTMVFENETLIGKGYSNTQVKTGIYRQKRGESE